MCDDKIQVSVPVEIDKCASCTPAPLWIGQTAFLGFFSKLSIAEIVKEGVCPPLRNEQIHISAVVHIASANTLPPTSSMQAGFGRYILKLHAAQIVVEVIFGLWPFTKMAAVYDEDVRQSVI